MLRTKRLYHRVNTLPCLIDAHGNTKWYQVRAAIHSGTLFWITWATIQDGRFPIMQHEG